MLISFYCSKSLATLWPCMGKTERRAVRAHPSVTSFGPLDATLRVLRLNPHEKQLLHAYTKNPTYSDLHQCRATVGTGCILATDSFHLKLLRNQSEGPCHACHSGIFSIVNAQAVNWQLVWAGTVPAYISHRFHWNPFQEQITKLDVSRREHVF